MLLQKLKLVDLPLGPGIKLTVPANYRMSLSVDSTAAPVPICGMSLLMMQMIYID